MKKCKIEKRILTEKVKNAKPEIQSLDFEVHDEKHAREMELEEKLKHARSHVQCLEEEISLYVEHNEQFDKILSDVEIHEREWEEGHKMLQEAAELILILQDNLKQQTIREK